LKLAGKFGYVRHTHWGKLFNVEIKRMPTDTAYTDDALSSHTDNPYREPVPGIQFLHCLENNVSGGLSTLVDGVAIIKQLELEMPEHSKILENVNVRFRYEGPSAILENWGSIIERNHNNIINRIRLSNRLDYVPALDKKTLDYFYAGRKRLNELSNHPNYQIQFPFKKGTLLMMDNYRLLHGRTKYNGAEGVRHLQGCYTDHDGVTSLYRMLSKGSKVTSVPTEL
jgi:gamma-butyrobetaine dioxygenase